MNPRIIFAVTALVSAVAGLLGVFVNKGSDSNVTPSKMESQNSPGNIQIAGSGNVVQVQPAAVKPNRPQKCQSISGEPDNKSREFIDCIYKNEGRIVELSVWLDDKELELVEKMFGDGKLYFHVSGNDFSVKIPKESDAYFSSYPRRSTTISGFFKVSNISGPYQGVMGVALKGVRIEDVH